MSLPLFVLLFAAAVFYGRLAWAVAKRLRQPTCRVCLHRGYCPIRERCSWDPTARYCFEEPVAIMPISQIGIPPSE